MTDEVVVKEADGTRGRRKRDRASTVSIVHVDFEPFLKKLFEEVKVSPDHELDEECIAFTSKTFGYVPTSRGLYLLDHDACSPDGREDPLTKSGRINVPLYKKYAPKENGVERMSIIPFAEAKISREILLEMPVTAVSNFGKWVRKFGDRLESNFHNWNNFLTPIYGEEHVKNLNT